MIFCRYGQLYQMIILGQKQEEQIIFISLNHSIYHKEETSSVFHKILRLSIIINITSKMEFMQLDGYNLIFKNLFNEQHASQLLSAVQTQVISLSFYNVGIKVMRLILAYFQESPITDITVDYNWNTIMTTPQLVCYDKNQWKTLQQLANWNREWNELFSSCYQAKKIELKIHCSWMDDQFAKKLLQGILKLPNIKSVSVELESKSATVENVLSAFSQAGLFNQFKYGFKLIK